MYFRYVMILIYILDIDKIFMFVLRMTPQEHPRKRKLRGNLNLSHMKTKFSWMEMR